MTTAAAITTIRSRKWIELSAGKMLTAGTAMSGSAKDPYLVNKICLFHYEYCGGKSKACEATK